jgi:hypothetical protein
MKIEAIRKCNFKKAINTNTTNYKIYKMYLLMLHIYKQIYITYSIGKRPTRVSGPPQKLKKSHLNISTTT